MSRRSLLTSVFRRAGGGVRADDPQGPQGRPLGTPAGRRAAERALAPTGLVVEAPPQFVAAESVAKAGVLVALPALLGQGRLEVGQRVYGGLQHGYSGLTAMLLTGNGKEKRDLLAT